MLLSEREDLWQQRDFNIVASQLEQAIMSAGDSFDSDSDISSPDPINEIENDNDIWLNDWLVVGPYRFEPRSMG